MDVKCSVKKQSPSIQLKVRNDSRLKFYSSIDVQCLTALFDPSLKMYEFITFLYTNYVYELTCKIQISVYKI